MGNCGIGITYLKKIGIGKFGIGIEVCSKKINPQINLVPFKFLIKQYFFHDSLGI